MLGDIFEKSEHKEIASIYYGNIVKDYPLSSLAPNAKNKLVAFKVPVPQPDPKAVAWMTAEQNAPRKRDGLVKKPLALVRTGPHNEMVASAKNGAPNLEPESEISGTDILTGGNKSQLGGPGGVGNTAVVETVTPGSAAPTTEAAPTAEGTPAATAPEAAAPAPTQPPATDANGNAPAAGAGSEQPAKADAATADGSQGADANKTNASQNTDDKKDATKESSSKKKKGLRKVVPW
jgi:hypothetical protein